MNLARFLKPLLIVVNRESAAPAEYEQKKDKSETRIIRIKSGLSQKVEEWARYQYRPKRAHGLAKVLLEIAWEISFASSG